MTGGEDARVDGLLPGYSVLGQPMRSSEFTFKGRTFDCLNPMLMSLTALFDNSNISRSGYVPDAFGHPMLLGPLEWSKFSDALRNSWNKCCNDAMAQQVPLADAVA